MGNTLDIFKSKTFRVLLLGLDSAGKSSICFTIGATFKDEGFHPAPIENPKWKNIQLVSWDLGGSDKIKRLWKHYLPGSNGIAFVFDSFDKDQEKIDLAKRDLFWVLEQSEVKDLPLLVMANKQDLEDAMTTAKVIEILNLNEIRDRKWHVQGTSCKNRQSIQDGLSWLRKNMI